MNEGEQLTQLCRRLGAEPGPAAAMAAQLQKRATQLSNERGITREAAMRYLLEILVKGRHGEISADAMPDRPAPSMREKLVALFHAHYGRAPEIIARAPGRIERLSVAVVLPRDLDDFEVERIQTLIAAAAGIDTTRGDRLEVSRLARTDTSAASLSAPPITAMRPIAIGTPQATAWSHWVLIVVASMLLGLIVAFGLQRRPRTLLPQEREAVLAKLRNWLSEGGALS